MPKPAKAKKARARATKKKLVAVAASGYGNLLGSIDTLLATARRHTARAVNACMTATYWHVGRYIVEYEQKGSDRAEYGDALLKILAADLTAKHGRGFSDRTLINARLFYLTFDPEWIYKTTTCEISGQITQTLSAQSSVDSQQLTNSPFTADTQLVPRQRDNLLNTPLSAFDLPTLAKAFPLPWSHYVMLISRSRSPEAREFYHREALRGGWSVRQLDRQIGTQFYERAALSKNKAAMLKKGETPRAGELLTPDEEIRDPLVLEFLNLRDEYSETELEDALIRHLETFLLELGNDFTFVGRQRRLRLDNKWYRIDLLFFHRRLRSLVVIDLKVGEFTHADAGQMNLYVNYAREHWTHPGENPPVGLILCAEKNETIARYALDGLETKIQAREYKHTLPSEKLLAAELAKTAKLLAQRKTEK
ncbi:putative nuclease of restriction endonuclease-like (RecB) superfamily [Ereboglobus sp. PH5-5]|uniref:PDDEXK nuclease domain-containing protein n=1 Tax=Ereboglobus sp. PH5-5 TaxID=2940529 RepID=UPI0024055D8E|nr:PDDEXK nuclease domain-containing protein [Ereboglobus sp. PH5-5]MDF9833981.1 putative nuclease of restriction endonuclease-like (RecB) superfamily [Ereboglobus sp. PH5-5]